VVFGPIPLVVFGTSDAGLEVIGKFDGMVVRSADFQQISLGVAD
jgi:hypothetical protein